MKDMQIQGMHRKLEMQAKELLRREKLIEILQNQLQKLRYQDARKQPQIISVICPNCNQSHTANQNPKQVNKVTESLKEEFLPELFSSSEKLPDALVKKAFRPDQID